MKRLVVGHPVVDLGRALRDAGVPVGTGRVRVCTEAVTLTPDQFYWAGRATLVSRPDDVATYDRVFRELFGSKTYELPDEEHAMRVQGGIAEVDVSVPGVEDDDLDDEDPLPGQASRAERLKRRNFSSMSEEELRLLAELVGRLQVTTPSRRTRRRVRATRGDLDMRATMRLALRTGGDPAQLRRRKRRERPRRIVLLLDISGSMSAYSRGLLIFAHAALLADHRWEAFSFGTRLTRLTGVLRASRPDEALARAAKEARDWDGGTRIGECIQSMLARYGRGESIRGAVVVICSDGLDVGDPQLLGDQMARLHRLAHRVVWLNPLSAHPDYQPLARGMAAALPHVDQFAAGHNLTELESIAEHLAGA